MNRFSKPVPLPIRDRYTVRQANNFEMRDETQLLMSKQYSTTTENQYSGDVSVKESSIHVKGSSIHVKTLGVSSESITQSITLGYESQQKFKYTNLFPTSPAKKSNSKSSKSNNATNLDLAQCISQTIQDTNPITTGSSEIKQLKQNKCSLPNPNPKQRVVPINQPILRSLRQKNFNRKQLQSISVTTPQLSARQKECTEPDALSILREETLEY